MSFARSTNHLLDDEPVEDPSQEVMAATLQEELSPPSIEAQADNFIQERDLEDYHDLEQEAKPEAPLVELKPLPSGLKYVFLNGNRKTPVIISDKLSEGETQRLVTILEKYQSLIGYSL